MTLIDVRFQVAGLLHVCLCKQRVIHSCAYWCCQNGYVPKSQSETSWKEQTDGYFDEDDMVDPEAGEKARRRVQQRLLAEKVREETIQHKFELVNRY